MLQREHSAILLTFIKPLFVIKFFVLSIFEWPFYMDFTACLKTDFILFDLILYVPVNNLSVTLGQVFLG